MYASLSLEMRDYIGGKTVTTSGSAGSVSDAKGCPELGGSSKHCNSHAIGAYHITVGAASDYQFGTNFTAMCWCTVDNLGFYDWVMAKHNTSAVIGWNLLRSSNNLMRFQVNNGGTSDCWGGPIILPGAWYHVAMTVDGTNLKGFVNGVQVAKVASTKNPNQTTEPLRIGNRRTTVAEGFIGSAQEAALFSRALSLNELQAYYRWAISNNTRKFFFVEPPAAGGGSAVPVFHASNFRRRVA